MLNDDEAKVKLKGLIERYISDKSEKERLIQVIEDPSRPGLPVRGVLEIIGKYKKQEYSEMEKEVISDLIYMYG